ncbi:double zinc ribbon and ankyrin repeat-containing protein 1 [Brachyhypopomus gauderio]|uniref:double zinc ribbon and ankyrin repeat-containing protein 1 n=1 Tax=Brachyhypopomus gauderio TaxID=698409 RepID=UPI004041FC37
MTAGSVVAPFIIPIRVAPPGKSKHDIDTTTPIEIKSDTPDVSIFYTLDGSKPEVWRRPGSGDSSTLKYTEPIRLPRGKVNVRAVAVTSDGRESAVVTKVFTVEYIPSEMQETLETKLEDQDNSWNISEQSDSKHDRSAFLKAQENCASDVSGKHFRTVARQGPQGPRQRVAPVAVAPQHTQEQSAATVHKLSKNLNRTQMSRIQRETDFLRCTVCLSPRPSDPFARFCLHCGAPVPPIPAQRLPPTEGGQMILCVQCKSMVPVNTFSCVVCEAPLEPQLRPQGKVICPSCGTGNPAHIPHCMTCETRLSETDRPLLNGQRAPPLPCSEGKMVSCSKCCRVNHSDARFCDWCGTKPGHVASVLTCSQCGASSHPYSNYCGSCGVFLEGPPRRTAQLGPQEGTLEPEQATESTATRVDVQTQTVGLFYPSGAELQRRSQKKELELSRQEKMSDRKPLLTAISPGRGFWRKQLDHICAHLRSHAQNNSEFRALVGEPRMGRLVSAAIEEDSYEVSLRVNFISASPELSRSSSAGPPSGFVAEKRNLSDVTEGRINLATRHTSMMSENGTAEFGSSTKSQKKESNDGLLLKEVGPEGRGQITVVQQLLDEGANPSCLGSDERPALVAAVLNGHHDVIPMLVQKGADVDQTSGPLNNTALHEAAVLGSEGLKSVEVLLGCNASLRKLNDRGQTAYDVAESTGCSAMRSLMMSHSGQGLVQPLPHSRSPSGLDTFS